MYDEVSGFSEWMASLGSGSKAAIRFGLRQRPLCGTKRAAGITGFHARLADRKIGITHMAGRGVFRTLSAAVRAYFSIGPV